MAKSKTVQKKTSYRTLRAIAFVGERVETGTILELSIEDLKNINPAYIERVDNVKEEVKKEEAKKVEEDKKEGTEIDV